MFCFKCGKEISDDAVFCDKCGTKIGDLAFSDNMTVKPCASKDKSAYAVKEKKQKMLAIYVAVCKIIVAMIFVLLTVNCISAFFTGPRVERLAEIFSEEIGGSGVLVVMILPALADISFYIYAYINRSFGKFFKSTIFITVIYGLIPLGLAFTMLNTFNDGMQEKEYTLTAGFWIMYILLLGVAVYSAVVYKKASDAEETAVYYENKDSIRGLRCLSDKKEIVSDWKCKHCGSINKTNQDYCKDCGKYR